jgi:hypothetical protein
MLENPAGYAASAAASKGDFWASTSIEMLFAAEFKRRHVPIRISWFPNGMRRIETCLSTFGWERTGKAKYKKGKWTPPVKMPFATI